MVVGSGSIVLIALGAILAFAVSDQSVGPLDLQVAGWILMVAGLIGLVISLYTWSGRRRMVAAPPQVQQVPPQVQQVPPQVQQVPPQVQQVPPQAPGVEHPLEDGVVEERRYRHHRS